MKTAEDWLMEPTNTPCITKDKIKQIQLDAMREGMRRAAVIANEREGDRRKLTTPIAILSAAENLKESDL